MYLSQESIIISDHNLSLAIKGSFPQTPPAKPYQWGFWEKAKLPKNPTARSPAWQSTEVLRICAEREKTSEKRNYHYFKIYLQF